MVPASDASYGDFPGKHGKQDSLTIPRIVTSRAETHTSVHVK